MKKLTLIRHAKSSWAEKGLSDFDRPLNKRGQNAAPFMGDRLKKHHLNPDIIISSPAKRAAQTIKILAEYLCYPQKKIVWDENVYEARSTTLLSLIRNINDKYSHALLCGHNPGFTDFSNQLCNRVIDNIPTCGVVCIRFEMPNWQEITFGTGELLLFDYPKRPES